MFEKIQQDVRLLMGDDANGHGYGHVMRVYETALEIARKEKADCEVVALAALLHDADDYKFFGAENAANLSNARRIMAENQVDADRIEKVCAIISTMGYSKALKGIRPQSLEGQIVSDADMLDAMGAFSVVRTLGFSITNGKTIFNPKIFPEQQLTNESYTAQDRKSDSFVNHFFDKLLKLKKMLFTSSARQEAKVRHQFMVDFLRQFFAEQRCWDWIEYLQQFEKDNDKAA